MGSGNLTEMGIINSGMNYVDEAIDRYVIDNIDVIADAESHDDTTHWRGLVARILEEVRARYPPEVADEVGAYAIDRVTAHRSEGPLFTDEVSRAFIKEHRKMPEGQAWIAYVKRHSNPEALLDTFL